MIKIKKEHLNKIIARGTFKFELKDGLTEAKLLFIHNKFNGAYTYIQKEKVEKIKKVDDNDKKGSNE
jgi:hypothetical protein